MKSIICLTLLFCSTLSFASKAIDPAVIKQITGLKGKYFDDEGVFKVTKPRTDVKIEVDRFQMPPFMGLTSWVSFTKGKKNEVMIMGDLVLFQDEVNPVMSVLFEKGIDVTALHNHFFYDDPKVYFMHVSGEGDQNSLANGVKAALDKVQEIRKQSPTPANNFGGNPLPEKNSISAKPLEDALKHPGDSKDGMFKAVFGIKTKMSCGCEIGKEMGVNTWAAFAGSDQDAIVDGDFAVKENKLQRMLRSLRSSNINIVAIHHHMSGEKPRILFLHYWGRGKSVELAQKVRLALKLTQ